MYKIDIDSSTRELYCIGDTHGAHNEVLYYMKRYEMADTAIICLGDCGMGFSTIEGTKKAMYKLNEYCKSNNCHIYMFRGNHDDPSYYAEGKIAMSNIKLIPDYTVIGYKGANILCIGGATSIDRSYRMRKYEAEVSSYLRFHPNSSNEDIEKLPKLYWYDEQPVYDEDKLDKIDINIDYVCTHTCPSFAMPLTKEGLSEWYLHDMLLYSDVDNERKVMDMIYHKLLTKGSKIKKWLYGHYHYHNSMEVDGIQFVMLDMVRDGVCDAYLLMKD